MSDSIVNITMPVFNRKDLTQLSIIHINKMSRSIPFELTVVDNGSSEDLRDTLIDYAENNLINNLYLLDRNTGVSCACNIGWRSINTPFFLKIDNDIIITDKNFLQKLLKIYNTVNTSCILGPALLDSMINDSEHVIESEFGKIALCTTNVPGGALLVPRVIHQIIGGFNEDYGLYGADDGDYGLRMNVAGFKQYYYEFKKFFEHRGKWDSSEYIGFDLDKAQEHKKLFHDHGIGLFTINAILYNLCIRNWKVPYRYEIIKIDKYHYNVHERSDYKKIINALNRSKKILDHRILQCKLDHLNPVIYSNELVQKLKKIWAQCGQSCDADNYN